MAVYFRRSSRNSDAGFDARHQQMIPRAGAGDVEQVALGVVDFLQIGVVADRLDALLQGDDLVVAGHHGHGAELQPLGQVHGADRDVAAGRFRRARRES